VEQLITGNLLPLKEFFTKMDNYIWQKSYKFLKRLHPNKGGKWLKKTYFPPYKDEKHHSN